LLLILLMHHLIAEHELWFGGIASSAGDSGGIVMSIASRTVPVALSSVTSLLLALLLLINVLRLVAGAKLAHDSRGIVQVRTIWAIPVTRMLA